EKVCHCVSRLAASRGVMLMKAAVGASTESSKTLNLLQNIDDAGIAGTRVAPGAIPALSQNLGDYSRESLSHPPPVPGEELRPDPLTSIFRRRPADSIHGRISV